jgi:hypothetical protein
MPAVFTANVGWQDRKLRRGNLKGAPHFVGKVCCNQRHRQLPESQGGVVVRVRVRQVRDNDAEPRPAGYIGRGRTRVEKRIPVRF